MQSYQLELDLVTGKADTLPRVIAVCHRYGCRIVSVSYDERISDRLVVVVNSQHRSGRPLSLKLENLVYVLAVRIQELQTARPDFSFLARWDWSAPAVYQGATDGLMRTGLRAHRRIP